MNALWLTIVVVAVTARAAAPPNGHEAAEDKARTTPGAASLGVKACHDDIEKWCRGVKPGEGRLGACLEKHAKELTPQCRRWSEHGGREQQVESLRELDKLPAAPAPER